MWLLVCSVLSDIVCCLLLCVGEVFLVVCSYVCYDACPLLCVRRGLWLVVYCMRLVFWLIAVFCSLVVE